MAAPQFNLEAQIRTLGADSLLPPAKPTPAQVDGLRRIRDHGPEAWCWGYRRAGGALARMFDRMVKEGWLDGPPYTIIAKGRAALDELARR